ncbi:MAG: ANTAR domain-containing protein [Mycobacteriaceae bacterium]
MKPEGDIASGAHVHEAVAKHPHEVADIVIGLAWTLRDADDLLEVLQRTVDMAVKVVVGATNAGVTVAVSGPPFTAAATNSLTLQVDARQYAAGDGPCLQAARTGEVVLVDLTTSPQQWPEFTTDARNVGVQSVLALPLGALNIYGPKIDAFSGRHVALLRVLTEQISRTVAEYATTIAATDLEAHLRQALVSRAPIEQAKGILMAVHHCTADEAFDRLRTQSQDTNTKLHDVATAFVATHTRPATTT